ncbi:MAG: SH3 domain-containing protein [Verrucomicrobiales bacterium]|nr:SH3 domain-containing protein [Verrucomicrobiales bacterium]
MNLRKFLLIASGLALGVMVSGCGGGSADLAYNYYLTEEAPLLEKGPRQQEPPLRMLSPGTRVRIISGGGAFTQVATVREETGWVPTAALRMQSSSGANPVNAYSGW